MSGFAPTIPMLGCEDQHSREIYTVEAPCPMCGEMLEYFSDELRTKNILRCLACKERFETQLFKKAAGM